MKNRRPTIEAQLAALREEFEEEAGFRCADKYWDYLTSSIRRIYEGPREGQARRRAEESEARQRRDQGLDELMRAAVRKRTPTAGILRAARSYCEMLERETPKDRPLRLVLGRDRLLRMLRAIKKTGA